MKIYFYNLHRKIAKILILIPIFNDFCLTLIFFFKYIIYYDLSIFQVFQIFLCYYFLYLRLNHQIFVFFIQNYENLNFSK